MATCRSSSKIIGKMNLQSILDNKKNSPWVQTESKFNIFGIAGKLVKYVVHLSKKIK
jgi:hypothetical protein